MFKYIFCRRIYGRFNKVVSVSSNNIQNNFIEKQYFIERENIIYNLIGNMKMEE